MEHESIVDFYDRKIAEDLGVPIEIVRENLNKLS